MTSPTPTTVAGTSTSAPVPTPHRGDGDTPGWVWILFALFVAMAVWAALSLLFGKDTGGNVKGYNQWN